MTAGSRVLIDASNLHSGGGVQVAASFINELFSLAEPPEWLDSATIRASTRVFDSLDDSVKPRVQVVDAFPSMRFLLPQNKPSFDVAFNVFGPTYRRREAKVEIAGLADPMIPAHYAPDEVLRELTTAAKLRARAKRIRIKSYEMITVETEPFARAIAASGVSRSLIHVVPNAASSVVLSHETSFGRDTDNTPFTFIYPARPYFHKNHHRIGPLLEALKQRGVKAQILVTLTEDEIAEIPDLNRAEVVPLGVLTQPQLAEAYDKADAVLFPSLLEVASATPLEAIGRGLPFFGSDRDFVRCQAGDAGWYFDPVNVESAADVIADALFQESEMTSKIDLGLSESLELPTAQQRASDYVRLIDSALQGEKLTPKQEALRVWVAHPAQQHSMKTAEAVKNAGYDLTYITPIYDRPGSLTNIVKSRLRGESKVRAEGRKSAGLDEHEIRQICEPIALVLLALQRVPRLRPVFNAWFRLLTWVFNRKLARMVAQEQPDILVAYDTFAADLFAAVGRKSPRTRKVLDLSAPSAPFMDRVLRDLAQTAEDPSLRAEIQNERSGFFYKTNLRYTNREIASADQFLVASRFSERSLLDLGVADERIAICRYGSPALAESATVHGKENTRMRVIFVGTCTIRKGIRQFIDLANELGSIFEFVAVGSLDPDSNLPALAPSIRWTGHVTRDQVYEELRKSDIIFFPSFGDGFGFSALEAMAAANVVVCSSNAGISDLVVNGYNGLVVETGRYREVVEFIRELDPDRDRLREMQANAVLTATDVTWGVYDRSIKVALARNAGEVA